jgi:hypothetical protein
MVVDFLQRGSAEKYDIEPEEGQVSVWYWRECMNISEALVQKLGAMGIEAKRLTGSVTGPKRSFSLHAWVELPDGSWIDPTSGQLGWPEALILMPDDKRRQFYIVADGAA